jgi:hypothetical protein
MQTVQSSLVPIQLSSDNGATFKDVVCLTSYDIPLNTPSTSVSTFCGQAVGLGNIAFNPKFSAVCDSAPDDDTVSYADVLAWQIAKTKLRFKVEYPGQGSASAGTVIYLEGDCRVTDTDFKAQVDDVLQFDVTLTGEGELQTEPA